MPVATDDSDIAAFDVVCENLNSPSFENAVGAKDGDLSFLSELLNGNVMQSLVEAHEVLTEDADLEPVSCDNIEILVDVCDDLNTQANKNPSARDLCDILASPHMKALIEAHDDIASKNYEVIPDVVPIFAPTTPQIFSAPTTDAIRMVGIRKNADESLGITVRKEANGDLVIARILAGSMIERQGLLTVGDIIKEINGQEVTDPDQLQELLKRASGSITLKILPSTADGNAASQMYVKSHFTFDPKRDNLIPCREAGLGFNTGDILQVLNTDDSNWWQAKKVDVNGPSGLIPSQTLEEKRKAFVKPEYDYTHKSLLCGLVTKKKKKLMYESKRNFQFDRTDILIYEEVARMPPFQRKTLVLVGAQGVGRRTLKNRLIKADASRFGSVIPHTSRPMRPGEVDGEAYLFLTKEEMTINIESNKFVEYGEFDGHFYGTKFDVIRKIIRSGKMCILDLNPQALKTIKNSEFMPYVVFVAAPPVEIMRNMHVYARQRGRTDKLKTERDFRNTLDESAKIERHYSHFFDLSIVNDNMDLTYNKLRKAIETLSTEPQWVPVSWVY